MRSPVITTSMKGLGIPSGIYIQRVSPFLNLVDGYDYATADFIWDDAWHNFDLSAVIPPEATQVRFLAELKSDAAGNYLAFCPKNYTGISAHKDRALTSSYAHQDEFEVEVTTPQKIQYKGKIYSGAITFLEVTVQGWWLQRPPY